MFHGGGKNHHPFAGFGKFHYLADDVRGNTILFFEFAIKIRFAKQAITLHLQAAKVVLHHRHIQPLRRGEVTVLYHVTQG